jgi:hypothetical protein
MLIRENVFGQPAYLIHVASNLEGWRHLFVYSLPIVILVTGIVPVQTDALTFLAYFAPYFIVTALACNELARSHVLWGAASVYDLARSPASIIAPLTALRERRFRVTPKARGARRRSPEALFTYALLLGSLGSVAYACGLALLGRSPLAGDSLAVVASWAGYHSFTAVRLLMLGERAHATAEY